MSESKTPWTPGPWRYQEESDAYTHIVRASGNRFLCQLSQDSSGVAEATARLIAAAPEIAELLLDLVKTEDGPLTKRAREILAKIGAAP